MLLLHGLGMSSTTWCHNIEALSKYFSIYALDLPGFGNSFAPYLSEYSLERYAETVYGVISALEIDRAHLVGSSFGGAIAALVSLRHPEKVNRLIVIGAVGFRATTFFGASINGPKKTSSREDMADFGFSDEVASKIIKNISPEMLQDLEKQTLLKRSVMVITGESDPLTQREAVCSIIARNPLAKCVIIPDAGHLPHEERPEAVNRHIISYCSGIQVNTFCG